MVWGLVDVTPHYYLSLLCYSDELEVQGEIIILKKTALPCPPLNLGCVVPGPLPSQCCHSPLLSHSRQKHRQNKPRLDLIRLSYWLRGVVDITFPRGSSVSRPLVPGEALLCQVIACSLACPVPVSNLPFSSSSSLLFFPPPPPHSLCQHHTSRSRSHDHPLLFPAFPPNSESLGSDRKSVV